MDAEFQERLRLQREILRGYNRRKRKLRPEIHRRSVRKQALKRYGLNEKQYEAILADQGGVCACCGKPESIKRRMCVDHDHKTGLVRGLLCNNCNAGIGHLGDTLEGVQMAIAYLSRIAALINEPVG